MADELGEKLRRWFPALATIFGLLVAALVGLPSGSWVAAVVTFVAYAGLAVLLAGAFLLQVLAGLFGHTRMDVIEVLSPLGPVIIRAGPRGVPRFLIGGPHLWAHIERSLRRDRAWTIHVRRRGDDLSGPDLYTEDVPSKAGVPAAMPRLAERAVRGDLWHGEGGP